MSSTEAGPPPTVGGGRYTLGELIGRGGAAEVFRARDELLGRDVAVKLFPAGVGEADDSRQRREVQTLAGMNHPGLVTIYDVGQDASRAYFVMQLIEGESLAERLRAGALETGDVVALGSALGDSLTYVHRHGVVHRDIKPGNVLLDAEGRPHLSDFGIAVLADATNITATGMVIGTASYLSPEQVRGQAVGPASDVYALGLVLLECVTARREYPGNALEAAVARLHRAPEIPADLPGPLGALLTGMTRDEPRERPTTDQVVGELRMLGREAGMDASTVLAPAPVTGTGAMRTQAMGPRTGPTSYVAQPTGATRRMQGPPPPYGGDRTALVGAGGPARGGPPTARGATAAAPAAGAGRRRGLVVAAVAAVALLAGIGVWALLSGGGQDDAEPPPSPLPLPTFEAPAPSSTTQAPTTQPPTTQQAPPPTTQQAPAPPPTEEPPPPSPQPTTTAPPTTEEPVEPEPPAEEPEPPTPTGGIEDLLPGTSG